jgi:hypothetical protein
MRLENLVREGREGTQSRHCEITFYTCAKAPARLLRAFPRALYFLDLSVLVLSSRLVASFADKPPFRP